jgi:hypothetical protein
MLDLPFRELLWQGWIRSLLGAIPYAIACYMADKMWPARTLMMFILQIAAILPVFVLCEAAMFWPEVVPFVRSRLSSLRPASVTAGAGGGR